MANPAFAPVLFDPADSRSLFERDADTRIWQPLEIESMHSIEFSPLMPVLSEDLAPPETGLPRPEDTPPTSYAGQDWSSFAHANDDLVREHVSHVEELQQRHQLEIEALRQAHANEMAQKLTGALKSSEEVLAQEVSDRLTRILAPIIAGHARKISIHAVIAELKRLLASGETSRILVTGPLDLINVVRASMGDDAARLAFEETGSADLTVEVNSSVIATRLTEWRKILLEALA